MLTINVPEREHFNEAKGVFVDTPAYVVTLEHSLISLSKWEAQFEKPFLSETAKTDDEVLAYIKCMILDPNVPPDIVENFSSENFEDVNNYIQAKMSATWFTEEPEGRRSSESITSELIYYWMLSMNIPMECENWHLNRLFTLIKICNTKNSAPKKMTPAQIAARNRELNARRKRELGTSG